MSETSPGHVGDVEQSIHAVEVDESAKIGEVLDNTLHHVANGDGFHELEAFLRAFLFDEFAAAEHHVLTVVVDFYDLEIISVADELLKIFWRNHVNL